MDEAGDHCVELEAPVVSPCEACEVSFGVVGTELSIGADESDPISLAQNWLNRSVQGGPDDR